MSFGSEADIIALFKPCDPRAQGFDEDVCLLEDGRVCSVDMLVEDVDFRRSTFSAADVAWKALAVNLSDLAACGAEPAGFVSALALPATTKEPWIREFAEALNEAAAFYRCPLLGGDLSSTPGPICVSLTIFGRVERLLRRRQSEVGDVLLVSGELAAAAAGFFALEHGIDAPRLIGKQRRPTPRLALGRFLASRPEVRGAMDLSDGLAADLPRFLALGHGAALDAQALPIALDTRAVAGADTATFALSGGEDFELLTAVAPEHTASLIAAAHAAGHTLTAIGEVRADPRFTLNGAALTPGYDHFR